MSQGTFAEVGKVLGLCSVPCCLGYGQSSGVQHVFGMLLGRHILAPEVALNADNLGLLGFGQVGTRHICVNLVQRQVSAYSLGLCMRSILIGIKIAIGTRRQHHAIAMLQGTVGILGVAPHHNSGVGRQVSGYNLVPANKLSAVALKKVSHTSNEVGLQTVLVARQLSHHLLAQGAAVPRLLGSLVATYVYVFGWKYVHNLAKHILQKVVCGNATRAEVGLLVRLVCARQFGICCKHLLGVSTRWRSWSWV